MTTCRQRSACSKVPWSKGQDTGLSSRRYWVQGLRSASVGAKRGPLDHSTPWGSLRLLSLKVRTPASQAGNDGFDSLWSPFGWVCLEARLLWSGGPCLATTGAGRRPADCKSVTQKHRRFEVSVPLRSAQDKRPLDVLRPAPSTFRLRVRAVYGATLLKWCAATHRRFKSFRKRFRAGMKFLALSVYILWHHVCAEPLEDCLAQRVSCARHFHTKFG